MSEKSPYKHRHRADHKKRPSRAIGVRTYTVKQVGDLWAVIAHGSHVSAHATESAATYRARDLNSLMGGTEAEGED